MILRRKAESFVSYTSDWEKVTVQGHSGLPQGQAKSKLKLIYGKWLPRFCCLYGAWLLIIISLGSGTWELSLIV